MWASRPYKNGCEFTAVASTFATLLLDSWNSGSTVLLHARQDRVGRAGEEAHVVHQNLGQMQRREQKLGQATSKAGSAAHMYRYLSPQ